MPLRGGSVFRITELGPRCTSTMRCTLSIDYGIVLSGELELLLDGGETIKLLAGDTVVQRGTSHARRNPSQDTRCKFLVCMIEAQPVTIDGNNLDRPYSPVSRLTSDFL